MMHGGGSSHGSRGRATLALNLTALIDVVFLLIMFFVLVAKFGRYQTLPLDLPHVGERTAKAIDPGARPAVDVVPRAKVNALGGAYRFGSSSFDDTPSGLESLTSAIRSMRASQPEIEVSVRAERSEPYARVHPAVLAVGAAGVKHVHLMTVPESSQSGVTP